MAYVLTLLLWPQIEVPEIEAEISARIELRHFNTLDVAVFSQLEAEICIGDIGAAVQEYGESRGYGVVREYVGHGVGRFLHEDPQVPNYGQAGRGPLLRPGMCIAIEPMLNLGDWRTTLLDDQWTVIPTYNPSKTVLWLKNGLPD